MEEDRESEESGRSIAKNKLQGQTLVLTVCAVGIGGTFQYGFNISLINAPTVYIQKFVNDTWFERWDTPLESKLLTLIWSFIVSIFPLGGLVGALMAGPMAVNFGRKKSLLLNNLFVIVAAMLMGFSRASGFFELILMGRFVSGINSGISMNIQPMYLGESAPKNLRGAVALTSAPFTALGIVLGQIIGLRELLGGEELWPVLLATIAVPGVIQLVALPWFPESPRYLLIDKGDKASCIIECQNLFIERLGRRLLLLCGYSLMSVWAVVFMVALALQDSISWMPYLSMACIFAYILSFGIGPAGVTGIIPTELFGQTSRPAAYTIGGSLMWIFLFIVGMLFPFIIVELGQFCYVPFCTVCVLSALYVFLFLPETKGKTVLEITEEFNKLNFKAAKQSPTPEHPEEALKSALIQPSSEKS
nr:PREDICTED: solute carrier family 2, facilitated glucose transporter member 11 [Latimeria chalumnae]|eukprot:XP_014344534.1 PREDICTED: solute carrier family 2, facilitated glucose transporter member 11 [Latimeria chalumnae]